MEISVMDIRGYLEEANDGINGEVMWLSDLSKYTPKELEKMPTGEYNGLLVYYSQKLKKEKEAYEEQKNKGNI